MSLKYLNEEEIRCLIKGATIFGTGGGGNPQNELKILFKDLREGKKIMLIDPNDVGDDALTI